MGVGPPEPGCRVRLQTTGRCAELKAWVVSGSGNGGARPRQVGTWKANGSEPLMRRRKGMSAIETELRIRLWDKARKGPVYGPGGGRRSFAKQIRRHAKRGRGKAPRAQPEPGGGASHVQAPVWNVGTERPDGTIRREANRTAWPTRPWPPEGQGPKARVKGEARGEEPRRVRVPMRDAGADWSVVAKKPGNAGGAKGPACPASGAVQPVRGGGCG